MKLSRIVLFAWIGCTVAMSAMAQDQTQPPPPPVASQAPAVAPREWVPEGISALGQNATSRTEFTLDHSMLVMVSKFDKDNEDLRRVVAGINGVSVHSFRFPIAVAFDPMVMASIRQQYREAGWQHLVSQHKSASGLATDFWVHMDHASIRDVAVLFVGVKQLNFVSVSGSITPTDLLHLSGHFGIPKMESGAIVPDRSR
jgi:hypothetical protein